MKELFFTLISRGLPALGAVFFNVVLIQTLEIDAAGSVFYWVTNLYLIGFISALGLDVFLLKKVSMGVFSLIGEEKRTAFLISCLIPFVAIPVVDNPAVLIMASLPFFNQVAINSKILRGKGHYFKAGIFEQTSIFSLAAFILWSCSMLRISLDAQGVTLIFLMAAIVVFSLTELMVGEGCRLIKINRHKFFHYEFSALSFVIFPLITYATQWMPVYFLNKMGESEISIYTISVRCASLLAFLALSMDSYLLPKIAKFHSEGEHEKIAELLCKFKNASIILSIFLGLIYILVGSVLVTSWAGDAYERSYYVAFPIISMYLLSIVSGPHQSYLLMSGGERHVNWANVMAFFIVVVLCFFLQETHLLSAGWAAAAILVGRGISIIYVWYCGRRLIDERLFAGQSKV